MSKLRGKRRVFVEEYLQCWNGTEAARRAGYKFPRREASRLLSIADVQAAIDERLDAIAMQTNEVLARLSEQARANMADFIDGAGGINWEAVKKQGYLIKRIVWRKGQQATIELYDAQTALMHLDRYHGGKEGEPLPNVVEIQDARSELKRRLSDIVERGRQADIPGEPE